MSRRRFIVAARTTGQNAARQAPPTVEEVAAVAGGISDYLGSLGASKVEIEEIPSLGGRKCPKCGKHLKRGGYFHILNCKQGA